MPASVVPDESLVISTRLVPAVPPLNELNAVMTQVPAVNDTDATVLYDVPTEPALDDLVPSTTVPIFEACPSDIKPLPAFMFPKNSEE